MADLTFDAVIAGGGNKALMLAMYLMKYGGMSVGVFERRHEIGGGLATEETAAPGFRGNTHANYILPWYYAPIHRDFPEFWEYGGKQDQHPAAYGGAFLDSGKCLVIYSEKDDPTQEKTAREMARFSEKDGDTWLKVWRFFQCDEYQRVVLDMLFNPHEWRTAPEFMERQAALFPRMIEAGVMPDSFLMQAPPIRVAKEVYDSPEAQFLPTRFFMSAAMNVNDATVGMNMLGQSGTLATLGLGRGGTHQFAHAAHQILVQGGCQFYTHAEVTRALIENGKCTGIQLKDGSTVKARKLVVSAGLSPAQLCFDLIGRDKLDQKLARRVDNLSYNNIGNILWYTFAMHQAPRYNCAGFNPDVDKAYVVVLAPRPDLEHLSRECHYAAMGMMPPMEVWTPAVWCMSVQDPSYAPPGKHVGNHELQGPGALDLSPADWLKLKHQHGEDMIAFWGKYASNMTPDNFIGVDTNGPYDYSRMQNLAPHGNFAGIDKSPWQNMDCRPTPELANHRTPIGNLYCTGGSWHCGAEASASASYNCYKIIAKDMGLAKPWEEKGKEEPESLVESTRWVVRKMRETYPPPKP